MTKTEFKSIAEEVFTELLPKVKSSDRNEAIEELLNELENQGLEVDDDEEDDSFTEDSLED